MSSLKKQYGFSLIELLMAMTISLIVLGAAVTVFSGALRTRTREADRTDAITSAQAALNIMSREIGNSGFGLSGSNGLVTQDCGLNSIRFRSNVHNEGVNGSNTAQEDEDVQYFLVGSGADRSVVRYDRFTGVTTGIINQVSNVEFIYHNYNPNGTNAPGPALDKSPVITDPHTARITITLEVILNNVPGQPPRTERVRSDVTLRNAAYNLGQY